MPEAEEPLDRLSEAEQRVLRLVAQGRSNAEIAKELWLTEQTVKFHLTHVYRKLGVRNRVQAALLAGSRGRWEPFERAELQLVSLALKRLADDLRESERGALLRKLGTEVDEVLFHSAERRRLGSSNVQACARVQAGESRSAAVS